MAHILLIGGHGKVAQLLTPVLLARSWSVTSMIRTAEQKGTIEKLGQGKPGRLNVLISSVEDVKSESDAQKILDEVKPDWVVWSAGTSYIMQISFSCPIHYTCLPYPCTCPMGFTIDIHMRLHTDKFQVLEDVEAHHVPRLLTKMLLFTSQRLASTQQASKSS